MSVIYHLGPLSLSVLIYLLLLSFNPIHASANENECRQADNNRIVVLKLGGSSITDKGTFETLDQSMLDWIASVVSNATTTIYYNLSSCIESDESNTSCCSSTSTKLLNKFVVVHGAGSFGHQVAKRYGLKGHTVDPPLHEPAGNTENNIMEGLAQTRLSVTKLNWHVVQTLLMHSIPAVAVSPFAVGLQAHGDPLISIRRNLNNGPDPMMTLMHVIRNALQVGLIPVLHGDAVLYGQQGAGILSGDTLVSQISVRSELTDSVLYSSSLDADATKTKRNAVVDVVFLTDVDGVFTSDPKRNKHATLLPIIEVDSNGKIISTSDNGQGIDVQLCETDGTPSSGSCSSTHEHDVTGGLQTKLKSAIDIAKTGIAQVYIVKCGSTDAMKVIRGEQHLERDTLIRLATTTDSIMPLVTDSPHEGIDTSRK